MKRSPAQVLGISAYATRDEARTAYRALARRWHPDRFMPGPEREWANERMTEINVAYAEFIKGVRNAHAADTEELSRVQGMIDDGNLSTARQLLMTLPTRCAEWNYLFGQVLYKLADYEKAIMYLSVAAHQEPGNAKYAAACAQAQQRMTRVSVRRHRFFR